MSRNIARNVALKVDDEVSDALRGAMLGSVFYLRFVEWVFRSDAIQGLFPDVELTVEHPFWSK
jgi:hypothetical protein